MEYFQSQLSFTLIFLSRQHKSLGAKSPVIMFVGGEVIIFFVEYGECTYSCHSNTAYERGLYNDMLHISKSSGIHGSILHKVCCYRSSFRSKHLVGSGKLTRLDAAAYLRI